MRRVVITGAGGPIGTLLRNGLTGLEVEAVQGRYLFPVIAPLIGATVIAAASLLPARARLPVGAAIGLLFVLGDFPYLLRHAEPAWWGAP